MAAPIPAGAAPAAFDPTAGAFVAQAERPAALGPVDVAALTPYQRSLLVIDGTVTRFIEAYWLEPVRVRRIAQDELRLPAGEPWLGLAAGETAIRRRVLLVGEHSGRFFAWADTLIAAARISPAVRRGLERDDGGLGRILIDTAAETRREGLWFGREAPADRPAEVAALWSGAFLARSYRVVAAGQALMQITERFPL
jgi:chorismate-pyruvate lyase